MKLQEMTTLRSHFAVVFLAACTGDGTVKLVEGLGVIPSRTLRMF